jgi:hypothetical protein
VDELVNQMVTAFLDQPEVALHVMGEHAGGEETYFHGLNCSILSMMLAKELGFARPTARSSASARCSTTSASTTFPTASPARATN